jgi:hypothetical protein
MPNVCHLPDPPWFSLQTTFKGTVSRDGFGFLAQLRYTPLVVSGNDKNKQLTKIIKPLQTRIYRKEYVNDSKFGETSEKIK